MNRKINYFKDQMFIGLKDKIVRPIAFFDIESTGLSTEHDQIIQINIQVLESNCMFNHTFWVMPICEIQPGAFEIHGIDMNMLKQKNAKPFKEIAKEVHTIFAGCDVAGYNILGFDLPMLETELARCGIIEDFSKRNIIDVFKLYKKVFSHSLTAAYENLTATKLDGAHEAETDVTASMVVLDRLLQHHNIGGNNDQWTAHYASDNEMVDYAGKFIKRDGVYYFNFGNDYGKAIQTNPGLIEWMLKKDFPNNTKVWCRRLLDMMYGTPEPEENKDVKAGSGSITDDLN